MKTVILVWKHRYYNYTTTRHDYFWGIGDMLRGAYGLFNLSKKMNFNLIVDYSLHPISRWLEATPHEYSQTIKDQQNTIPLVYPTNNVIKYIETQLETADMTMLYTNLGLEEYDHPPSTEAKTFMKSLLIPTAEFQHYIDTVNVSIPFSDYSILHYRLGDEELVRSNMRNTLRYKDHLLKHIEKNDILLSDSTTFKQMIKRDKIDIFMFDAPICHLGVHTDPNAVKHTLFELLLLSKATKIKSYSIHGWVSGFTHMISILYDIPLETQLNI